MRNVQAGVLLSVAVILNSAGGCTSTRVLRVARFSPDLSTMDMAVLSADMSTRNGDTGVYPWATANRTTPTTPMTAKENAVIAETPVIARRTLVK